MAIRLKLKHSATANKAPLPSDLEAGELALNTNAASPAAYIKDSAGNIVKLAGAGAVGAADATTTTKGVVTLADAAAITAGTAGRVVDAAQLKANVPALADASETVKGIVELATAAETTTGTDATRAVHPAGLKVELDKKAPLDSPALIGVPTAPTAAAGTNTTQLATTAFVHAATPTATASVAGVDVKLWKRTGTTLETETTNDSVSVGGKLLVGTTSAVGSQRLQVVGGDEARVRIHRNVSDAYEATLFLSKARGASSELVSNNDTIGSIFFEGGDGASLKGAAGISAQVDGTPGANDMPGRLVFSTTADGASSPTERMRIGSQGILNCFSNSGVGFNFHHAGQTNETNNGISLFAGSTNNSNGTRTFTVLNSGNVQNANNSYGSLSDAKLKENIVDAATQWADIKALQVRNYNLKEETGQSTHTQIGLVAQEVELVSPGLVTESPDRDAEGNDLGTVTKSVNYSVLYMKAVKALQEAMERIEALETRITTLEARP